MNELSSKSEEKNRYQFDENEEKKTKKKNKTIDCASIYDNSSLLSKYTYSYLWPLNAKVRRNISALESDDFDNYAPCSCLAGKHGHARGKDVKSSGKSELVRKWQAELKRRKHKKQEDNSRPDNDKANLFRAIACAYKLPFLMIVLFILLSDCLFEPAYFFLSVRLVELINQFPGGKVTVDGARSSASLQLGISNITRTANNADVMHTGFLSPQSNIESELNLTAALFCVCISCYQLLTHPYQWYASKLALKLRVSLSELIYAKALRVDKLRAASEQRLNYRQAMNLISRDLESLEGNMQQVAWVFSAPTQALLLTCIVGQHLDLPTALIAFLINCAIAYQRGYMNVAVRRYTHQASNLADARVNLISEALEAIRLIRMYAWTRPIEEQIESTRQDEWRARKRVLFVNSLDAAIFFISCSASAILSVIFGHYVRDLPINQSMVTQVFLISAFYRRILTRQLPQGIMSWMNVLVIIARCEQYLGAADQEDKRYSLTACKDKDSPSTPVVILKQVTFTWPKAAALIYQQQLARGKKKKKNRKEAAEQVSTCEHALETPSPCFSEIAMSAHSGELILVAGRVGSGKSTLLRLLLGELAPSSGVLELRANTKLAYASQEAWIFSGSVRDNILFGAPLNLERYIDVLRSCSLVPDLCAFAQFDRTLIGERGVTLSGGQKARINLARAFYQRADLYLLDDPLSAVDAHVARHIFEEALRRYLKGKTVILVTHQVQYLDQVDKILYLGSSTESNNNNQETTICNFFGTYDELVNSQLHSELLLSCRNSVASSSDIASEKSDQAKQQQECTKSEISRDYVIQRLKESEIFSDAQVSSRSTSDEMVELARRSRRGEGDSAPMRATRERLSSVTRAMSFYMRHAGSWLEHTSFILSNTVRVIKNEQGVAKLIPRVISPFKISIRFSVQNDCSQTARCCLRERRAY